VSQVCVIGAGSSGIAACQTLKARGVPFVCFEKGSQVGGNWRYENDNGMSSAYSSLFVDTSRERMAYATFPMPPDYPDYPHHTEVAAYFDAYVDHFGFREDIRFRTEVTNVEPAPGGGWNVTVDDGEPQHFSAVVVANGHHWDAKYPDFEGKFSGEAIHSHYYKTPHGYEGKRVLVVGFGNSAVDMACETSRVSKVTYLSTRRGAHVIPKYLGGKPIDQFGSPSATRLPLSVQRFFLASLLKLAYGRMEDYGLPAPDHKLFEAHFTVSSDLLHRIGHGAVKPKPNIARLEGQRVRFADGSVEQVDSIIYATGYRITFPFFADDLVSAPDNRISLYQHVVHPDLDGLYFVGLIQPHGAFMPLAEAQAEWVADLIDGTAALPSPAHMRKALEREERRLAERYVTSPRHTIQVDFYPYMRELARERRRGRRRRRPGDPTPVHRGAPAPVRESLATASLDRRGS
jgi:dimethylaniline monooxygenase (N-oxide forming)